MPEDSIPPETLASEQAPFSAAAPGREGDRVGPYIILEKRGEGGMGSVYLAEQTVPVRRRVALKVIKHGMDTERFIARFEAERQALALMDHPAIARIYDAGTTPQGRPYFAMEYVEGVPITTYCDRRGLSTRERLDLFLQVCEGVQHAHQKAVIHRDLKPTNVLVCDQDGRPAAKIIDFGLAKALDQPLTERTLFTEFGVMIGTPEYMSPEQAEGAGQNVDTRSDVYSLGVMLYELLVGALPFDSAELRGAGFDEIRRRIREEDPPRPSARFSTLGARRGQSAQRRRTEPKALRRDLRGDLDWITMRALEKDPARRYASPSELAEDVRRHLRSEPVLAHAPSARYRAGRFVRRHRLGVAAAAVMAVSLTAGTIVSTAGLVRARRAEARARTEAAAKGQVADFLKNLFKVSDPSTGRGNSITARELLDRAARTIDTRLASEPTTQAEMAGLMGEVYRSLGLYAPAETLCRKALDIRRRVLGPEHLDTAEAMLNLGNVYLFEARFPETEPLYTGALAIRKRLLGPEHIKTIDCMTNLSALYGNEGRIAAQESLASVALEISRRVLGPEHPNTLTLMGNQVRVYQKLGRLAEAERIGAETLEIESRVLGPDHPEVLRTMTNLALVYQGQGRFEDAARLDAQILEIQKRVLGPEHPDVLWSMNNLALAYQSVGRFDEAQRLHAQTLEIRRRVLGSRHPATLASLYNLACVAAKRGDRAVAMNWLRQDVDSGETDFDTMANDAELASLHGPEFDALLARVHRNAAANQTGSSESR